MLPGNCLAVSSNHISPHRSFTCPKLPRTKHLLHTGNNQRKLTRISHPGGKRTPKGKEGLCLSLRTGVGAVPAGWAGVFTNLDPGVGLAKARRWHGELGELQHGGQPGQKRQGQQEATGRGRPSVILRSTPLPRVCHPCRLSTDTGRAWDF